MLNNKSYLKCFYFYEKKYQKKISPDTTISEIKEWLKRKGINESCTFFIDGNELGDEDCTINDIVNGNFEEIKNITINIRDFELEKKKEEERLKEERLKEEKLEKEKLEKEKLEKERLEKEKKKRFNRDIY